MSFVAACTVVLLAQTPFPIEPEDPSADQTEPLLACDTFGCSVAWSRTVGANSGGVRERWLSFDGGLGSATSGPMLGGVSAGTLQGSGAWDGLRLYVITPNGVLGESQVYSVFTPNPFDTIDSATSTSLSPQYESGGVASFAHTGELGLLAYGAIGGPAVMPQVFLQVVAPNGGSLGFAVHPTQTVNAVRDPALVEHDGTFYLLFFDRWDTNQYDPFLTVWSPDAGFIIDHLMLENTTGEDETQGAMVVNQDHLITAWTSVSNLGTDVIIRRLEFDGGFGPGFIDLNGELTPMLAWANGRGLLAAQFGTNTGGQQADLMRLDEDGAGLHISPLFSATSASLMDLSVQQPDEEHAFFAYTVDDGGFIRTFVLPLDFGPPDSGAPDAGSTLDGGSPADAGAQGDGGSTHLPDGGVEPAHTYGIACGCTLGSPFPLLLLAAALVRRVKLRPVGPRFPQ